MDTPDLNRPDLYINRELSMLEFNRRVLAQARDTGNPLLERLKFLCIASTNMDEFFEIRVAGLKQRIEMGATQAGIDGLSPQEVLHAVRERVERLVAEQYRVLNDELIPELAGEGIRFARRHAWTKAQHRWLRRYFQNQVLPVLSPMGLDPAHPFPRILNKSLNFIVSLSGQDAFGRSTSLAVVQAPRSLPRLIHLPRRSGRRTGTDFVFLSSVIHAFVDQLFPGMEIRGCYQFRVTRNSELFVDEEEVEDLLRAVEGELPSRRYGDEVRLEVAQECPDDVADDLLAEFGLGDEDLYRVNGPVNLNRLLEVYDLVERSDLKFAGFTPAIPPPLRQAKNVFEAVRRRDVLFYHPFDAFAPVVDFLRRGAVDPQVLAIKLTLYRTGPESPVVDALVRAAEAGKEVTAVIELRARFDEAANIALANRLQEAGAHVLYGVVGYKTHAKLALVVRREGRALRRYVHLGTGNYHPKTARLYTDYGLLTSDPVLGEDVHRVFMRLTSLGRFARLTRLLDAPFTLHRAMLERIEREIRHARAGEDARIIVKVNALIEPQLVRALYRASMAGINIDLIVRGMCSLRPGIPGISDNIRVRSVVGRFLEHARVFYFHNGGEPELLAGSADWMERNMFRRVEVCFPVDDPELREQMLRDLECYLRDNTQTWILQSDGSYLRSTPGRATPFCAQEALLAEHGDGAR
ncbi:MAG TPA: polyphosphate kinase 1 [Gammaproteobacteria bacterium]|nr:polyphosphate kinase 1 [Gammaproteobacteria bacterium]